MKRMSGIMSRINFHFQVLHGFAIIPEEHEVLAWSKIKPAKEGWRDSRLAYGEGYNYRPHSH